MVFSWHLPSLFGLVVACQFFKALNTCFGWILWRTRKAFLLLYLWERRRVKDLPCPRTMPTKQELRKNRHTGGSCRVLGFQRCGFTPRCLREDGGLQRNISLLFCVAFIPQVCISVYDYRRALVRRASDESIYNEPYGEISKSKSQSQSQSQQMKTWTRFGELSRTLASTRKQQRLDF